MGKTCSFFQPDFGIIVAFLKFNLHIHINKNSFMRSSGGI